VTRLSFGWGTAAIILCNVCQRQHDIAEGIAASLMMQNKRQNNKSLGTDLSRLCRSDYLGCKLPVQQQCPNAAVLTLTPVRLSRIMYTIKDRKHDMCMLMTFASIERPSMKQPRGEMQCNHDGGLLAVSPSLTDPPDDPLDQVSAFTNPGNRCRRSVFPRGTCHRIVSATSNAHLKGDVRRYRIRVVAGRSLGP
jgi:hypothetical protein